MPELPEVETVVRDLKRGGLEGRRIQDVSLLWARTAATHAPEVFKRELKGRLIREVSRRAKFIVMRLEPQGWLLVHLRMTGRLDLTAHAAPPDPYERVVLALDDGRFLRFKDIRKFGRWYFYLTKPPQFETLGPEPLAETFTAGILKERIRGRDRQLKPLLLDQTIVAGLGNIYVDEALWLAGLHPLKRSARLHEDEVGRLHGAIVQVLKCGVKNAGTTLGTHEQNYYSVGKRRGRNQDELKVFRRTGAPCPACGTKIIRLVVGQRSTHVCPKCQKKR
ncbi:MAG: DNA-formamidopyrimidine glycosylase [Omnitrophica bacterium GWA2_52_12]|nr:MAG: DNA-formamidopyrimidine glycosylase [Omnitrophica bacterium GWA2_52_12]